MKPTTETAAERARKIALYEANIARLEGQIARIEKGRRSYRWIALASVVLAPFGLFLHPIAPVMTLLVGVSIYFVGHYIAFMHITEDNNAKALSLESIAALRDTAGEAQTPPAS
jgi:hypothetical protein